MNCPRCRHTGSYELKFRFKAQDIDIIAQVCKTCEFIWSDDKQQLKAIQKWLHYLGQQNVKSS